MRLATMSESERAEAVSEFNARFGEMERALWYLSRSCRGPLLERRGTPAVEILVWTAKSWWGVQGVRSETQTLMAQALASLDWSAELFEERSHVPDAAEDYACDLVSTLVARSMAQGVLRREFSLASKVLHWLLPWRVPAYDSFVRVTLGVPASWDHPTAYREVAREVFRLARELESQDSTWLGPIEPRSLVRGLDKCLWWSGGGREGRAAVVRDPWRVVRQLGIPLC